MFSFLLLKTQSLSAAGGEKEKEEIKQMEGGSEDKQENVGVLLLQRTRTKKKILKNSEST